MKICGLTQLALLACLLPGAEVAAELVNTPQQLFQVARESADAGDIESALSILDQLRLAHPHDVDYAFARAQLFARQGRDAEALDELNAAMKLAPDYEEVRLLHEALLARQKKLADDAVQWLLLAGAGYQRLGGGLPPWNEQFFEVSRTQIDAWTYRIGIARDDRFEQADLAVSIGGDVHFASHWLTGFSLAVAGDADFRPDLEYKAKLGRSIQDGWVVAASLGRREYAATAVTNVSASLEKYHGKFRGAYSLLASRLPGAETMFGHVLALNWYYNDRSSIGLTINTGKEAEAIGPGQVLETDVRGLSLNGRRQINERFGLQWWLGLHEQGDYYRRDYLGLAVSIKL